MFYTCKIYLEIYLEIYLKLYVLNIVGLEKIHMVPYFSRFYIFQLAYSVELNPTQRRIAKVKNYHSSSPKVPLSDSYLVKIAFSRILNFGTWFLPLQIYNQPIWWVQTNELVKIVETLISNYLNQASKTAEEFKS